MMPFINTNLYPIVERTMAVRESKDDGDEDFYVENTVYLGLVDKDTGLRFRCIHPLGVDYYTRHTADASGSLKFIEVMEKWQVLGCPNNWSPDMWKPINQDGSFIELH